MDPSFITDLLASDPDDVPPTAPLKVFAPNPVGRVS